MTIRIDVAADGEKRYMQVQSGVALPTPKGKKAASEPSKRTEYPFNTMADLDMFWVPNRKACNAVTQAFKSAKYAEARAKGYLETVSVKKFAADIRAKVNNDDAIGVFFRAYTPEELAERAAAAAEQGDKP